MQSDLDGSTYDLYLHIGVSALQPNLLLERRARRFGYRRLDVNNCSAPSKGGDTEHCGFGVTHEWEREALPDELYTSVPLELIKSQLAPKWGDRLQTSSDPGKDSV